MSSKLITLQQSHERLAHQDKRHVKQLLQRRDVRVQNNTTFCSSCTLGKQHMKSCKPREIRATSPAEIIFADLCGSMEARCLVINDDYSRFRRVFFLKEKIEVPGCIESFLAEAKKWLKHL